MAFSITLSLTEESTRSTPTVTRDDAKRIGDYLRIDWNEVSLDEFHQGITVEFEHADLIGADAVAAGKIALAHLKELPDYYTRLSSLERITTPRD